MGATKYQALRNHIQQNLEYSQKNRASRNNQVILPIPINQVNLVSLVNQMFQANQVNLDIQTNLVIPANQALLTNQALPVNPATQGSRKVVLEVLQRHL